MSERQFFPLSPLKNFCLLKGIKLGGGGGGGGGDMCGNWQTISKLISSPVDFLDRMGVWILDGVIWHSQLLPFVLTKSSIDHTMVMIVVDMSQPWGIMDSLERWAEVLRKHIETLGIPEKVKKEMRERSKFGRVGGGWE